MKDKIVMSVTLGLVCFLLVFIMYIQIKTVSNADVLSLETMQETELRSQIVQEKTKYEEVLVKYQEVVDKITEYNENITNNKDILKDELKQANMLFGKTNVIGDGIIVEMKDTDMKSITDIDLLLLVNELRASGAEAISINGQRICVNTEIRSVYKFVFINGERIASPYVIKAIGDPAYLESGLTIKGGYVDETKALGQEITLRKENSIMITKYAGETEIKYLEKVEGEI